MRPRRGKRRRLRELVTLELDLMPMLNVFISIIPLLLLSAAFVPVTVIKTTLPADSVVEVDTPGAAPLELAIFILPELYVVQVNGAVSTTIPRPTGSAAAPAEAARARLAQALRGIAAAHPGSREVRILSQPTTRYEEIIGVMDASRAAGLPEAALAIGAS